MGSLNNTFAGVPMLQSWEDVALWEFVLNRHRTELCGIVELGTYHGGFSRLLYAQAVARGMTFATIDRDAPAQVTPGFRQLDLHDPRAPAAVRDLLPAPGILLCDNGDKPWELRTFAPILEPGELLIVHDWQTEVGPADVPDCLRPLYHDSPEMRASSSAVFARC
jgi:cephalosporin hydroxylase